MNRKGESDTQFLGQTLTEQLNTFGYHVFSYLSLGIGAADDTVDSTRTRTKDCGMGDRVAA